MSAPTANSNPFGAPTIGRQTVYGQLPVAPSYPVAQLAFSVTDTITAFKDYAQVSTAGYRYAAIFLNVTAITGTSPTVKARLMGVGAFYNVSLASTAIENAVGYYTLFIGPGLAAAAILLPQVLIEVDPGGTSPSVSFELELWLW